MEMEFINEFECKYFNLKIFYNNILNKYKIDLIINNTINSSYNKYFNYIKDYLKFYNMKSNYYTYDEAKDCINLLLDENKFLNYINKYVVNKNKELFINDINDIIKKHNMNKSMEDIEETHKPVCEKKCDKNNYNKEINNFFEKLENLSKEEQNKEKDNDMNDDIYDLPFFNPNIMNRIKFNDLGTFPIPRKLQETKQETKPEIKKEMKQDKQTINSIPILFFGPYMKEYEQKQPNKMSSPLSQQQKTPEVINPSITPNKYLSKEDLETIINKALETLSDEEMN